MSQQEVLPTPENVAIATVRRTINILNEAITIRGEAVWVLAGGSSPMAAYKLIAEKHNNDLDWQKVKFIIGDERCVAYDHKDSNLGQIEKTFLDKLNYDANKLLKPKIDHGPEKAAELYSEEIDRLTKNEAGSPILDLVWLGIGEDGHTLSLFPNDKKIKSYNEYVVPIFDSPKPPLERVTLSLKAISATRKAIFMVSGAGKAEVYKKIKSKDPYLPCVLVEQTIEKAGGEVVWLVDSEVSAQL